ncbi:MAG: 50S ribosomal protein L44e [Candidatus Thorarchaeota archaeon]
MKMASSLNKYCPRCTAHTVHEISAEKAGKRRSMSRGERRMRKKTKGYGSFPKPIQKRFAKTTKKTVLRMKCKDCGYIIQSKGMRLKKVEIAKA